MASPDSLLIGVHASAAGGVHNALLNGIELGATTIQLFTSNQRQWTGKMIPEKEVELWHTTLKSSRLEKIMSHDSYLINLGSPDPHMLHKSQKAFQLEIMRCHQLGISFLNFHPGAYTSSSEDECLRQIIKSLSELEDLVSRGATRLLFEATAGQGTTVGYCFEHLGYLIDALHTKIPIGVCIDTCHIFVAGYDITTKEGWNKTLQDFDKHIGLKHLHALHVNDSLKPLGARVDRHASLGKGKMGIDCFKIMMQHPDLAALPKYLETPDHTIWKQEIELLRSFA